MSLFQPALRAPASAHGASTKGRRRFTKALTCWSAAAVVIGTGVTLAEPAQAATTGTILIGADGDVASVQRGTGEPMATHTYKFFSQSVPTGAASITVRDPNHTWKQIAAAGPGSTIYNQIVNWAQTIKSRGTKIMLSYHHEAEASGSNKFGTPADFVAAYRHVVTIFRNQGVTNVEWVWQPTAFSFVVKPSDRRYYMNWYPGDAYVDNVGFDGYNAGQCFGRNEWRPMSQFTDPVLAFARAHGKKVSLQEFAAPQDPRRAAWIQDSHNYLAAHKDIIDAAFWFQNGAVGSSCSWRLTTSAEYKAYGDMARDTAAFRS